MVEQIAALGAIKRRAGLDVALGVGEEGDAAVGGRALGQARGERALPIRVGLSVLSLRLSAATSAISASRSSRRGERRAACLE